MKTALGGGDIRQLRESVQGLAEAGNVLSRLIYRNADATDPFKTDPARPAQRGGHVPGQASSGALLRRSGSAWRCRPRPAAKRRRCA